MPQHTEFLTPSFVDALMANFDEAARVALVVRDQAVPEVKDVQLPPPLLIGRFTAHSRIATSASATPSFQHLENSRESALSGAFFVLDPNWFATQHLYTGIATKRPGGVSSNQEFGRVSRLLPECSGTRLQESITALLHEPDSSIQLPTANVPKRFPAPGSSGKLPPAMCRSATVA